MHSIRITVRLFSHFTKYLPSDAIRDTFSIQLSETMSGGEVIEKLKIPDSVRRIITVNDENCSEDKILRDGDVVKIFPVAMGG
jgi:molybdopterin converting factor small subunit